MENSSTRRLLVILVCAVALAASGIAFDLGFERLAAARASVARHEALIRRLEKSLPDEAQMRRQRDDLLNEVQSRTARFYSADETDPYAFGAMVRRKLTSLGIVVRRYQVSEAKGASYLDFSVTASPRAFVTFLRDISVAPKIWTIPSLVLSLPDGSGTVTVDFRIGYAVGNS